MSLLRSFLLLAVLIVYASACQGSQPPRTRGNIQQMGNNGKEEEKTAPMGKKEPAKEKKKTEAEKKMELETYILTWDDVQGGMLGTSEKTIQDLANKLKIEKELLEQHAETARKEQDPAKMAKYVKFLKMFDDVNARENNGTGK